MISFFSDYFPPSLLHAHVTVVFTQAAVVQKIFEAYLEMFLSVKIDNIKQPSFDAMMLDYPDLHEDSFPKLVMMASMYVCPYI